MTLASRPLGLAVLAVALGMSTASAAPYTWTTSGSGSLRTDGSGTWNTSALNWTTTGAGTAVAWPNLTTDVAVFGAGSGAAGTVTVDSVSTNGITFNQPGSGIYLLSGGTITLGGSSPTLTTNAGVSAQIASSLAGSAGLSTTGSGTLTLSRSSAVSGTATFGAGEVILASGAALPSFTGLTVGAQLGASTLRVQSGASLTVSMSSGAAFIGNNTTSRPLGMVVQEGGVVTVSGNAGNLQLSSNASTTTYTGSASYVLQGGTLALNNSTAGYIVVGRNALATFTQSGGAVTLARAGDALIIGDYSTGSYAISAGSLTAASTSANALLGGRGGTGTLTVSGTGSMGLGGAMFLAVNSGNSTTNKGSATVNLQGGSLAVNGMTLGRTTGSGTTGSNGPGTATFNFSGGTLRPYSVNTSIGSATAANNFAIDLSGTGATLSGIDLAGSAARRLDVYATLQGTGNITVAGGTVALQAANTHSGTTSAQAGTLALGSVDALQNSTLDVSSTVTFTVAGTNTYNVGALTGATNLDVGPNTLSVGGNGASTTYSGVLSGTATAGLTKVGTGVLTLAGSNSYGGATTVNQGTLVLGVNAVGSGSGAMGTSKNGVTVGSATGSGTAALLLDGGVTIDSRNVQIPAVVSGSQIVILGGANTSGTATFGSVGSMGFNLGRDVTLQAATGGTVEFNNAWSNGTGRNVTIGSAGNAGTVQLGSALAVTGAVSVTSGTLRLASGGSLADAASVIVGRAGSSGAVLDVTPQVGTFTTGSTQTLGGSGTLRLDADTPVSIAGIFSPGNSPGLFTFDGANTTTLAGTTLMEIEGTSRGTTAGYDAVNLTGGATLALGGALQLWFSGTFANDTTFNLFTLSGSGLSGNFTGVSVSGTSGAYTGLSWTQSSGTWTSTTTTGGQALRFSSTDGTLVVVPEPAALALAAVGIGLAGWAALRRRK